MNMTGLARSWSHADQGSEEKALEQFLLAVQEERWVTDLRAAAIYQHGFEIGQVMLGSLSCSDNLKVIMHVCAGKDIQKWTECDMFDYPWESTLSGLYVLRWSYGQ